MLRGFSQCGQLWRSLVAQDAMLLLRETTLTVESISSTLQGVSRCINCVCFCPYSTISQHIPPFPSISQYWHGRRFTIAVRILTAYASGTKSHICWWRVESFFAADQINHKIWIHHDISMNLCVLCVYVSVTYYVFALCILSNIYIYNLYIYTYSPWSSYSQTLPSQCTRSKGADLATWLTSFSLMASLGCSALPEATGWGDSWGVSKQLK